MKYYCIINKTKVEAQKMAQVMETGKILKYDKKLKKAGNALHAGMETMGEFSKLALYYKNKEELIMTDYTKELARLKTAIEKAKEIMLEGRNLKQRNRGKRGKLNYWRVRKRLGMEPEELVAS